VPPRWLAGELEASRPALTRYRPDQLTNTAVALARLGRVPPSGWLEAFEGATSSKMSAFTLQVRCSGVGCDGAVGGVVLEIVFRSNQLPITHKPIHPPSP